jgi:RNA polymerase sigma-70 factor (ECF subfamily)
MEEAIVTGRSFIRGVPTGPGASVDDAALVLMAQADPKRFAELYDHYVDLVYRACYSRLQSVTAAEDATSITFFNALAALHTFDPCARPFRSWLFAIAHNAVTDHFRSLQRRPETALDAVDEQVDRRQLPDDQAVLNDESRRLRTAMAALTDEQQQILELRLAGLNGPEIAEALGRNQGAIRTAQHRAFQRLRTLLSPGEGSAPAGKEAHHG